MAVDDGSRLTGGPEDDAAQAHAAFEAGLVARGEAAELREDGTLPPGATHEIVHDENGQHLVRRRFSAF
jgi:hypothetical protein